MQYDHRRALREHESAIDAPPTFDYDDKEHLECNAHRALIDAALMMAYMKYPKESAMAFFFLAFTAGTDEDLSHTPPAQTEAQPAAQPQTQKGE